MKFLFGVISGLLTAFGMGGGIVLISFLTNIEKYSLRQAQYINLLIYIITAGITTCVNYSKKEMDFKIINKILPIFILFSLLLNYVSKNMEKNMLKKYFGYFVILSGILQILQIIYMHIKDNFAKPKIRGDKNV